MQQQAEKPELVRARLGLFDAISIILGIVIGATIYQSPPIIMKNVPGPWVGLGVWALCGLLSLIGALCYAELATTYPRTGGDYYFLSRAFGPWAGFLFGWAQLVAVLTGSIGAMAFVFANYASRLWPDGPPQFAYAAMAVVVLSLLNILGVVFGKLVQNLLTLAKVVGLGGIIVAGFLYGNQSLTAAPAPAAGGDPPNIGLAMILVLYAYGGWNDAAFVAAEVRNRRHMSLALILGTLGVTIIYLAINAAYLQVLGFEGLRQSDNVATDVLKLVLHERGELAMRVLVMVSALGAINGLIFTGARVYAQLGAQHRIFAGLGRWNAGSGSPVGAFTVQAAITLLMILLVGTEPGRQGIDRLMTAATLEPIPWQAYFGGFETLVAATAPVFWTFFLLTGLSLFALRQRDPAIERPFTVPFYPVVPLIFCATCFYMLLSSIDYAKRLALLAAVPVLFGLVLYLIDEWLAPAKAGPPPGAD
jgi:basic amino acid/polyamine antiporter, APA family